jgi:hypothetical protein
LQIFSDAAVVSAVAVLRVFLRGVFGNSVFWVWFLGGEVVVSRVVDVVK